MKRRDLLAGLAGVPLVAGLGATAAAQEAWEEAGVEGIVCPVTVGRYGYQKGLSVKDFVPCAVAVYGLRVKHLADQFPEVKERQRQWFPTEQAAQLVNEPDLGRLIAGFVPPPEGRAAPIIGE